MDGLPEEKIVIIAGHRMAKTCIGSEAKVGNFTIAEDAAITGSNTIHFHTHMKFKGCESDVVILLDVDPADARWADSQLYTAASRAKHKLFVINSAPEVRLPQAVKAGNV